MIRQTVEFFVWVGAGALIVALLLCVMTLCALAAGESPAEWLRDFLR